MLMFVLIFVFIVIIIRMCPHCLTTVLFPTPRDIIADQLGEAFHLCGLVQRAKGRLQV